MDTIKTVCKRLWAWLTTNTYKPPPDTVVQRRARMIFQGMANLAIALFGVWLAWVEFGSDIFRANLFWLIVGIWAYLSFTMFLLRWDDAAKKTTSEKVDGLDARFDDLTKKFDDLIKEVRGLRKDLSNKGGSDGDSKDK